MIPKYFRPVPRLYADFNLKTGPEYWDYLNFTPIWGGDSRNYQVLSPLGTGKFSNVSKVISLLDDRFYTMKQLKLLKANSMVKYCREIKVLQNLKGGPNIPTLHDQILNEDGSVTLILEYIEADKFRVLSSSFNSFEIRYYVYELLKALDYSHSHGIMHRDVKPGNICIDHKARKLRLIDWGLAEFYRPGQKNHLRVSTMSYKAPELLAQCPLYHYSIDSWSLGATLAGVIFRKDPFFFGKELIEQLLVITDFVGTEALFNYAERHNLELPEELLGAVSYEPKKSLKMYLSRENQELVTPDTLDFIDKLLEFDHSERILAGEALQHPYFDPVRELMHRVSIGSWDVPKDSLETAKILASRRR